MKKAVPIITFLLLSVLASCRKEHLYGEREIFIGKWQWDATFYQYNCFPLDTEWITPATWDTTYGIEITNKEKIYFLKNGDVHEESPISVANFTDSRSLQNGYRFSIYFDESGSYLLSGNVNADSLVLEEYWPDAFIDESCHEYTHYFIKNEE